MPKSILVIDDEEYDESKFDERTKDFIREFKSHIKYFEYEGPESKRSKKWWIFRSLEWSMMFFVIKF